MSSISRGRPVELGREARRRAREDRVGPTGAREVGRAFEDGFDTGTDSACDEGMADPDTTVEECQELVD